MFYEQRKDQKRHIRKEVNKFLLVSDDHSRVVLSKVGDVEGSDYINANHLDVSKYILSFFFFILNLLILNNDNLLLYYVLGILQA